MASSKDGGIGPRTGSSNNRRKSVIRAAVRTTMEDLEARTMFSASPVNLSNWEEQGPGPVLGTGSLINGSSSPIAGAVNVIAPDPGNADIMYVGTVNGGIWRTSNATNASGPTWTPLTDQYPSLSIGALTYDPSDAQHHTLWAG